LELVPSKKGEKPREVYVRSIVPRGPSGRTALGRGEKSTFVTVNGGLGLREGDSFQVGRPKPGVRGALRLMAKIERVPRSAGERGAGAGGELGAGITSSLGTSGRRGPWSSCGRSTAVRSSPP
jgi:hypothetical protein